MKRYQHIALATLAIAIAAAGCATGGGGVNPLVGAWNLTVESQLGTMEQVLTVGDDLSGVITIAEPAEATMNVTDLALDGQNVTFNVVFNIEGTELPAKFVGTLDGDTLTGEYVTDLGNGTVTGTRVS